MIAFREVAHLYVGCEAIYGGYGQEEKVRINAADMKHDKLEFSFMERDHKDDGDVHSWFKPILRSLEDIGEEEVRELIHMDIFGGGFPDEGYEMRLSMIKKNHGIQYVVFKHAKHFISGTFGFSKWTPEQFCKLLSWNFDLFNLIPNGQAIRKEPQK